MYLGSPFRVQLSKARRVMSDLLAGDLSVYCTAQLIADANLPGCARHAKSDCPIRNRMMLYKYGAVPAFILLLNSDSMKRKGLSEIAVAYADVSAVLFK